MMKTISYLLKRGAIVALITAWIFSGFPSIWNDPPFPPPVMPALAADTFRVTTYEFEGTEFTGATYSLTLNNTLQSDYFVMIAGASSANDLRGPDEDGVRVSGDPFGNGDLSTSASGTVLDLTRGSAGNEWRGTVTVVECLGDCDASGFELKEVLVTAVSAGTADATQTATDTLAENFTAQTVPFGGIRGGGLSSSSSDSGSYGVTVNTRVQLTSTDTLTLSRDGGTGKTPAAITFVTYIVEWGSEWDVYDVDIDDWVAGGSIHSDGSYATGTIGATVTRANTWIWGTSSAMEDGLQHHGHVYSLGAGATENSTETTVAVKARISDGAGDERQSTIYVMQHSSIAVDWRHKSDGDTGSASGYQELSVTIDGANGSESYDNSASDVRYTEGYRFYYNTHTSDGNGQAYSRALAWAGRITADTTVAAWRQYAGTANEFWDQVVDFAAVTYSSNTAPTVTINAASQLTDGSGIVPINFDVDDADDNDVKVKILYDSGSCGTPTSDATMVTSSSTADFDDSGGEPSVSNSDEYQVGTTATRRIITSSGSNTVIADWDSSADVSSANGTYCVSTTANDDTADGTVATASLTVDNVDPATPGNLIIGTTTPRTVALGFGSQSSDTNFSRYRVFYKIGTSGVAETDTEHTGDESTLTSVTYDGQATTTISGLTPDTDYVFNIWAYDDYCVTDLANCTQNKASATEVTVRTEKDAIRATEYLIESSSFTGLTYELTLDQNLSEDYFVTVRGAEDGDSQWGPDSNNIALVADPFGTGDLESSSGSDKLKFLRGAFNASRSWVGVVTVFESLGATTTEGFDLLTVERIQHSGAETSGRATSSVLWSDVGQVTPIGGYRGAGCDTEDSDAGDHLDCYIRLYPSGTRTLHWTRDGTSATSLETASSTVMVVEWGSSWTIQHVNVTGSSYGDGVDIAAEYDTGDIVQVKRANTFVWGTGVTDEAGVGDGADGTVITLGDGTTTESAYESTVAVGGEYSANRSFDVYVITHEDLAVDYRFKTDGGSSSLTSDLTVDFSTPSTTHATLVYSSQGSTSTSYPQPIVSSRYTATDEVRLERTYQGSNFAAWVQGIDFSSVGYDSQATPTKQYARSGTLYSSSIDLDSYPTAVNRNALRMEWTQTIPEGCFLDVYIQGTNTGPTPDYSTSTLVGPFASASTTVAIDLTGRASLQGKRFFRYNVDMLSCDSRAKTPTLYDIFIEFD